MPIATKSLKQSINLPCSPAQAYKALLSSKEHSAITGAKAKISARVGGKSTMYDGYAEAGNLELVAGKKIVQAWRAEDWPEGHYSKVTFAFKATKTGCTLNFTQTGIPAKELGAMKSGWVEFYWQPIAAHFGKKAR